MHCSKKIFSQHKAIVALERGKKSRSDRRREVRHYWCAPCQGYHLTSKELTITNTELKHKDKWMNYLEQESDELNLV